MMAPTAEAPDDVRRLIGRERAGDAEARELVAERALRVALRTATALLGDRDRAADVAQTVAVAAISHLAALRDPAAFDAWVHRAAVREALRVRRAQQRRHRHETAWDELATEPAAGDDPDVALRVTVAERLAALPARQRSAVILRYVHDLPDERIADALRCRVGTVHALLSRARSALRADPAMRHLIHDDPDGTR